MKVSAVQEPPVYYDLERTLARGADIIARAAADGAELVVFPEAWVPGYVDFVWSVLPNNLQSDFNDIDQRLWRNAVDLSRDGLAPIRDAARDNGVVVVVGINERSDEMSGGTLYNTGVIIDATGEILNAHRKLMPTNPERQVWGFGDGSTLRVVDTAVGRVGALLCWENFMPLARMALYAQNVEVYCAPTAFTPDLNDASMRHIAKEGGCAVVGVAPAVPVSALPQDFPAREALADGDEWLLNGGAIIVHPGGDIAGGPMRDTTGLLTADVDMDLVRMSRRTFDVAGHYARPDVFSLTVDTTHRMPVHFNSSDHD